MLRGINDDEVLDIARLAREHPYQVRFIELMPTTSQTWWQRHFCHERRSANGWRSWGL